MMEYDKLRAKEGKTRCERSYSYVLIFRKTKKFRYFLHKLLHNALNMRINIQKFKYRNHIRERKGK